MKWNLNIGRWFGIPVRLHFTFLLVIGLLAIANGVAGGGLGAAVDGVLFFCALFGCVLLHELGHALMARRYGVKTKDIILLPIGGVARLERMPDKPIQEFWIALAGPAVNVAIALLLGVWLWVNGSWNSLAAFGTAELGFASQMLTANLFLVLFNLLPAFPMDGGRVLRSLLAMRMHYAKATRIAGTVGKSMAVIFAIVGLFINPMLFLIAAFVWFGATREMNLAETRSAISGLTVREAMVTDFRVVDRDTPLLQVARLTLAGTQQDFPVLDRGRYAGMLNRRQLLDGLNRYGVAAPASDVMESDLPVLQDDESVQSLLTRNASSGQSTLPVLRNGLLVGLFTTENLSELLLLKAALIDERPDARMEQWNVVLSRSPALPARA